MNLTLSHEVAPINKSRAIVKMRRRKFAKAPMRCLRDIAFVLKMTQKVRAPTSTPANDATNSLA